LFWKNICTNDDQDATSNERRKTQINQFKKALSFCKNAFDLPQISSMIKIKRELYEETIWKVMSDPDLFRKKQEIKYSMEIAVEYKDEKFSNAKISSLEIIGGTLTSLGAGAIGVGSYIAGATLVKIVTYGTTGGFLGLFTTATTTTISSAYVLGSAATTVTTTAGLSTIPASIYAAAPFIIAGGVAVVNSKKCMKTIKARLF
jgi:hypothetical protein